MSENSDKDWGRIDAAGRLEIRRRFGERVVVEEGEKGAVEKKAKVKLWRGIGSKKWSDVDAADLPGMEERVQVVKSK